MGGTIAAAVLGLACGLAGGLFGVGGGFIAIPVLGMLYGLPQQAAQGTVLLMVVPNVLFALWNYGRRVGIDRRMAITLALSALVSTYPVARVATRLDPHLLRLGFAAFLAVLAVVGAWRLRRGRSIPPPVRLALSWRWLALVGIVGGVASGLFGVGGAFVGAPLLTGLFGVRQIVAQGLALAIVAPGGIIALAAYAQAGQVDWPVGVPLALGGTAAIPFGVALAHRLPERRLRLGFCGLLAATAGLLAWHG